MAKQKNTSNKDSGKTGDVSLPAEVTSGITQHIKPVETLYENWFLEYASYVILDRAVPYVDDGLKPVQRRILHALNELDDGRFNKVANVIGHAMQYHPHGDASIGDAIVNLGQRNLLIDTQGNWGNIHTGDNAAAPRYIEARLSKFAKEVVFNPKTTTWQLSYDGRKQEPVTLPMKFPLLLAQGAEGIAVGLSTKILPHNFIELCEASIAALRRQPFTLYPDFLTGGLVDVNEYKAGERSGRIRSRARIKELDKKTLVITELAHGTTTVSLIESIIKANDKGKIKIKNIDDNTAKHVEILINLIPGTSPDITIDALYAFTDCEVSLSPNCCIILNDKPLFTTVDDVLRRSAENTKGLLKRELEIRLDELNEDWHFSSLEKIFIEKRIYRDIEEATTWEQVLANIDKGLKPYKKQFRREITQDDIVKLTEIRIKRISKFDSFKADEHIRGLEAEMEEVKNDLAHLTDYTVKFYKELIKKYGKGRERRTEIKAFETIQANTVAAANVKLYVNRVEGFIGWGLKKDEFVADCSDLDDIIVLREDGKMTVVKMADKVFVGKGVLHVAVFRRDDDRTVYHMVYQDGRAGKSMAKRFKVQGITRAKEYDLTRGTAGTKVLYLSVLPNGEGEVVTVRHKDVPRLRRLEFNFDFGQMAIKGRSAGGNLLTKWPVRSVKRKSLGASTLGGRAIYFEPDVMRLNTDQRGDYLGTFSGDDKLLVLYDNGSYELTNYELTNRYDGKGRVVDICKYDPERIVSAIYMDAAGSYFAKRFLIETTTPDKTFSFIGEEAGSKLLYATIKLAPEVQLMVQGKRGATTEGDKLELEEFEIKGWKAVGKKLTTTPIVSVELLAYEEDPMLAEQADAEEEEAEAPKRAPKPKADKPKPANKPKGAPKPTKGKGKPGRGGNTLF